MKTVIKFARGECGYSENNLIGIKGMIGKILNKYEFEVYLIEEKGMKYYDFFYHQTHSNIFITQLTEITEQEIISAFKEVLFIFKNPVKKQKIIDDWIIRDQQTTRWEIEFNKKEMDDYEKHIEDFILEAEGIKRRPNIRARFKLLKKIDKNLWEFKTDKYIFRLEKYKYKNIWYQYELKQFNSKTKKQINKDIRYISRTPDEFEDGIIFTLEEDNIEQKAKELIDWTKAYKGIPWDALDGERQYMITLRKNGTLQALAEDDVADENHVWYFTTVLSGMDIYDKNGNCLMTMKEFEKIQEKIIKDGYKKYLKNKIIVKK